MWFVNGVDRRHIIITIGVPPPHHDGIRDIVIIINLGFFFWLFLASITREPDYIILYCTKNHLPTFFFCDITII